MSIPIFQGSEGEPVEGAVGTGSHNRYTDVPLVTSFVTPVAEDNCKIGSIQAMRADQCAETIVEATPESQHDANNAIVDWDSPIPDSTVPEAAPASGHMALAKGVMMSLAADAKHGAQVARVCLGIDAKVQKARESLPLARINFPRTSSAASAGTAVAEPEEGMTDLCEPPEVRAQIQRFQDSHVLLIKLLSAFEDYKRHRQGLADAGQRIGMALQEAGQHNPGSIGEAIVDCGKAHRQAATRREEAIKAEELHSLSMLRMHHAAAARDCQRAVREYEATRHELHLLNKARQEARVTKEASGDSQLTPTVEKAATQAEEKVNQRLHTAIDTVRGKLAMFEAKHTVDYAAAVSYHMKSVAAEELHVAEDFAKIDRAVSTILGAANCAELNHY